MKNMKAIGFKEHLPIESEKSLVDINKEIPVVQGHDLLVKVNAVSVNPVDVSVRRNGRGQLKYPKIIGWDAVRNGRGQLKYPKIIGWDAVGTV
ncbi:MAG TPA: hypothetical protein DG851_00065, partial [Lactobacillus acetotolerans]|nr:hypothetical protein [Lactobacillus acetotolerans]